MMTRRSPTLILFNYDFDAIGFKRVCETKGEAVPDDAGFDLFSFPSNANLVWFDMDRFVNRLAKKAKSKGWTAVVSSQEQFGALTAAMLAEKMGCRRESDFLHVRLGLMQVWRHPSPADLAATP